MCGKVFPFNRIKSTGTDTDFPKINSGRYQNPTNPKQDPPKAFVAFEDLNSPE
jgi:hypothetical protein